MENSKHHSNERIVTQTWMKDVNLEREYNNEAAYKFHREWEIRSVPILLY